LLHRFLSLGANINPRNGTGESPAFHFFRKGSMAVTLPEWDYDTALQSLHPSDRRDEQHRSHRIRWAATVVEQESQLWALLNQVDVDWLATSTHRETLLHVVAADVTGEEDDYRTWPRRRLGRFRVLRAKELMSWLKTRNIRQHCTLG
jgi:hypothetical protein